MTIYIGNLNEIIEDNHLKEAFEDYGTVSSTKVILNRYTKKSRCFGFIEMPNDMEAMKAIEELDGGSWEGKIIIVKKGRN
jgi:RNA recognition motif-containing protein